MNPKLLELIETLKAKSLAGVGAGNVLSIFLCGGSDPGSTALRRSVGDYLARIRSHYRYSVHYPEDMFIELILGHQRQDLLQLENLLGGSVNAVAILLHSPGTFAELGAFANHEKIRDKLIVVVDPRYKMTKSFINLGPIRMLKTRTRSKILYVPMDEGSVAEIAKQMASAVRDMAKHSAPSADLSNPITCYEFYLAMIYVLDPMDEREIEQVVRLFGGPDRERSMTVAQTVLNSLINERKVMRNGRMLATTGKGAEILLYSGRTRKAALETVQFLSGLRLKALNLTLRRRKKADHAWVG